MLYKMENVHGGDIYSQDIILDYSVSLNPLGTPQEVIKAIQNAAVLSERYPDPYCRELISAIAEKEEVSAGHIICSNGGAELIFACCDALLPRNPAVIMPAFSEYSNAVIRNGQIAAGYHTDEKNGFLLDEGILKFISEKKPDLLFLCTPNNPDGQLIPDDLLDEILKECDRTGCRVFLDECFLELSDGYESSKADRIDRYPGLLILKAFTKSYSMAGVRLGYALSSDTQLLSRICRRMQPWNVSVMAQAAGLAALRCKGYLEKARKIIKTERQWLADELGRTGICVYPSRANFMLIRMPQETGPEADINADVSRTRNTLGKLLLEKGILIRSCDRFDGLGKGWYRICVKQRRDNERFTEAVKDAVKRIKND